MIFADQKTLQAISSTTIIEPIVRYNSTQTAINTIPDALYLADFL